jgi:hypothetical protein
LRPLGRELAPAARFCRNCGHPVAGHADQAAPVPGRSGYAPTATALPVPGPPAPGASVPPRSGTPSRGTPPRRVAVAWPLIVALAFLAAGGSTTIWLFLIRHSPVQARAQAQVGVTHPPATSSPPTQPPSPATEQQAAQGLSALLAQSAAGRSSIQNAVNDVSQCGPDLSQDAQTLQNAATSRQNLLAKLASLPGTSDLPSQMVQALTGAWQASAQADQDFTRWAQDESARGLYAQRPD